MSRIRRLWCRIRGHDWRPDLRHRLMEFDLSTLPPGAVIERVVYIPPGGEVEPDFTVTVSTNGWPQSEPDPLWGAGLVDTTVRYAICARCGVDAIPEEHPILRVEYRDGGER